MTLVSLSFREKDWTVSLTTVEGRERFELAIGRYQREQLAGSNPKSATLVKRKDGSYSIQICVETEPSPPQRTDRVLGVDLGRTDIAHTKVARQKNRPVKAFKGGFATYDARIFSFREKDWTVSLTTVEGRERFELAIGRYQREQLAGSNPKSATLVKRKDGSYSIQICVETEPSPPQRTDRVLGVDLGRTDIAHTSEGDNWNGQQLSRVRERYSRLRAVLQHKASKGTRSARRRCRALLQRLSGKERRFQTWVNHRISKAIVSRAKATNSAIALEDLTGIRERINQQPRSTAERRRANSWAFYQLRQFLEYKALRAGVALILVPPAYTSQTCHRCLHIHPDPAQSYRSGKKFKCGHCGWEGDADLNGANVIALLGAAVNQPRGSGLFCSLVEHDRLRATESPLRTA
jgi:putative transposase